MKIIKGQNPHSLVPFFLKVLFLRDDIQRLLELPQASLPGCLTPSWTYCLRSQEKRPNELATQASLASMERNANKNSCRESPWQFVLPLVISRCHPFLLFFALKDMVSNGQQTSTHM